MDKERKIIKFESDDPKEEIEGLREELDLAMIERKRMKRIIDIFLLFLFLLFIVYTTL